MKFGKKLLALTVVSVMSLSLISCGEKKDQSVLDKDKLILGFDDTFVPMGFKDSNGEYVGFDIDLAKAISENPTTKTPCDESLTPIQFPPGITSIFFTLCTETCFIGISPSKFTFNFSSLYSTLLKGPTFGSADITSTSLLV